MNQREALVSLQQKFTSGNSVPVDRAVITRAEYEAIMAALPAQNEAQDEERVLLPAMLTAENGAKYTLTGEFFETYTDRCPDCDADSQDLPTDRCGTCNDSGEVEYKVDVSWSTIKAIYSRVVSQFSVEPLPVHTGSSFQSRVVPWLVECFGEEIAGDITERAHRMLEEALELFQSKGLTKSEAIQLVDYVFSREVGDPPQEVGGLMVTLAAMSNACGINMHDAGEVELARIWTKIPAIRAKQASKPAMSPLPGVYPEREYQGGH